MVVEPHFASTLGLHVDDQNREPTAPEVYLGFADDVRGANPRPGFPRSLNEMTMSSTAPPTLIVRLMTQASCSSLALCLGLVALVAPARAQEPATSAAPPVSGDAPASPAQPSAGDQSAGAVPPDPATTSRSPYECMPACRSGYTCVQNQCVSACNPPCGEGEMCASDGICMSACNPLCPAGQHCVGPGRCEPNVSPAPTPANSYAGPVPAVEAYQGPPQESARVTGKKFHNGFYLRIGVGVGAFLGSAKASDAPSGGEGSAPVYDEVDSSGVAIPVEFALGGTPAPGFAIGVGSYAVHVPSALYSTGRGDYAISERADYGSISMFGPFFDYYFDPEKGFHLELAPGFVGVNPGKSDVIVTDDLSGSGWGVMAGLGVETWISDQWSIGVLARTQFVSVKLKDSSDEEFDFVAFVPGLLMTLTLH